MPEIVLPPSIFRMELVIASPGNQDFIHVQRGDQKAQQPGTEPDKKRDQQIGTHRGDLVVLKMFLQKTDTDGKNNRCDRIRKGPSEENGKGAGCEDTSDQDDRKRFPAFRDFLQAVSQLVRR